MEFDKKAISVARDEPTPCTAARPVLKDGGPIVSKRLLQLHSLKAD
jgi:hypothetical protein